MKTYDLQLHVATFLLICGFIYCCLLGFNIYHAVQEVVSLNWAVSITTADKEKEPHIATVVSVFFLAILLFEAHICSTGCHFARTG